MKTQILCLLGLVLTHSLFALDCTARIANRTYHVNLGERAGMPYLKVVNDAGTTYEGIPVKYYSAIYKTDTYTLAPGFRRGGVEIEMGKSANPEVAFCLDQGTCTYCR